MDGDKRTTRFSVINKRPTPLDYKITVNNRKLELPEDFAEKVLEIESWIDKGEFTSEDLNELILLYSQAVEYYNSISSHKAVYYTDRIQMALMKPHVLEKMKVVHSDPGSATKVDEEIKQKREEEK